MATRSNTKVSRRWVLKATGVGVGAAALGVVVLKNPLRLGAGSPGPTGDNQVVPPHKPALLVDDEVAALLGPIQPGLALGKGLTVRAVRGVHLGAIGVLVTDAAGTAMRVDVLRRDNAGPSAPAQTDSLAVFVANQGRGDTRTAPHHQFAANQIARLLGARERQGAALPALLTHRERRSRHPGGIYALDA